MASMLKREVNIAITPHVNMICQMVVDGLEVVEHRRGNEGGFRRDDAIYHRFLRQTGHTAAFKRLLSKPFYQETGIEVIGITRLDRQVDEIKKESGNELNNLFSLNTVKKSETFLIGRYPKVIVFSDFLYNGKEMDNAWEVIHNSTALMNKLQLAVFLG